MNQRHRIVIGVRETMAYIAAGSTVGYFIMPTNIVLVLASGVTAGSLMYDAMHLAFHFDDVLPQFVRNTYWFKSMQSAHMRHHFRDNSREFGVTVDLWDRVYGTERK